jgi:serine/threonine-protein kinase
MRRRHKFMWAVGSIAVTVLGLMAISTLAPDSALVRGSTVGFEEDDDEQPPGAQGVADAWREFGFNNRKTRHNRALDQLGPPGRRLWTLDAGSLVEFPPVVADGMGVVGTNRHRLIGFDLATGRKKWNEKVPGPVASSPAIHKGVAYVTTITGHLVAQRVSDGRRQWKVKLGTSSESSPTIVDDGMYVGTTDGDVIRMDFAGREVWRARVPGDVKSAIAAYKDMVIASDYAGHVTALAQSDGARRWSVSTPGRAFRGSGRFYAGPAVQYGRVYVGNVNGRMVALDADTGDLAWLRSTNDWIYSSAAIAEQTVFVGSYDRRLYAFDAASGDLRWTFDAGERISGSPVVIGRLVYVSTLTPGGHSVGTTFALDMRTGQRVWSIPDGRYAAAVATRSHILVIGRRKIYGYEPT